MVGGGCAGGGASGGATFLFMLLLLPYLSSSHPLCTDSRAPLIPKTPLTFCSYNGTTCCDSIKDSQLQKQFQSFNVSDIACASIVKSILCAQCDQFSAELFKTESEVRTIPVLCNSTQSKVTTNNFCAKVWDTCQNVSILNSPFASSLQGTTPIPKNTNSSKLSDIWQEKTDFCKVFGGSPIGESVCFNGEQVSLNDTEKLSPPNGLCIEKIGNGSYLNMVPHPDGSNRVFLSNQQGEIWLATLPEMGSGGLLELNESNPFLDLTDEVHFDSEFGLLGIAFHPNFVSNGRFFVSYNCDKVTSPRCSGRCSCNSEANCDPSKLGSDNGGQPCQFHSVIAEYSSNGTSSTPTPATIAIPSEVRRIFTMGLPFTGHHGGQILFGPKDGNLYFMMGDGGRIGDPYNFSQNKKSLLGKIMRFDIDNIPNAKVISDLGLWGNYSIPRDNPYIQDKDLEPEIWAMGLRNPWRCSFDSYRPSYFLCADVGQEQFEEVDIITKGGNYGWRVYEGYNLYNPPNSPGGNTSTNSINPIFPVMGYKHSDINNQEGSASITGGYFYRSKTDPCTYGKYLYADLYAHALWAATETPEGSGKFNSTLIPFSCGRKSPIKCSSTVGSIEPSLGYIFSFGEDNKKDVYILTSNGVYRVVPPSHCSYTCSKENATSDIGNPGLGPSSSSYSTSPFGPNGLKKILFFSYLLFVLSSVF